RAQRFALEQLHGEKQAAVAGAAEVEHLDHVLVVNLRDRRRLAAKAFDGQIIARELVMEQLDRDRPAQRDVLGAINDARAAFTDAILKQIAFADEPPNQSIARGRRARARARLPAHRTEESFGGKVRSATGAGGFRSVHDGGTILPRLPSSG